MVQGQRGTRRSFPPRDVRRTQVAFASLRQRNLVTRTFSQREIEQVKRYLMHLGADTTWRRIVQGDMIGYTLMAHEHTEMEHFRRKGLDPFNYQDFAAYYEEAHAQALVSEHKIHQRLARDALGYSLNLATLVWCQETLSLMSKREPMIFSSCKDIHVTKRFAPLMCRKPMNTTQS